MICNLEEPEETEQEKSQEVNDSSSQEYVEIKKELEVLKNMISEIMSKKPEKMSESDDCEDVGQVVVSSDL